MICIPSFEISGLLFLAISLMFHLFKRVLCCGKNCIRPFRDRKKKTFHKRTGKVKGVQKVGFPLQPLLKPKENIYLFISILTFIYYLLVTHVLNLIFYEFILNIVSFIIFYFNAMNHKYNFIPRTWEKKMLEESINDGDI